MRSLWMRLAAAATAGVGAALTEIVLTHSVHGASFDASGPLAQVAVRTASVVALLSLLTGILLWAALRRADVSAGASAAAGAASWYFVAAAYLTFPGPPDWAASPARQAVLAAAASLLLAGAFALALRAAPDSLRRLAAGAGTAAPAILAATSWLQWRRHEAGVSGGTLAVWAAAVALILFLSWRRPRGAAALNLGLAAAGVALAAALPSGPPPAPAPGPAASPSVPRAVLITIDTLRRDALSLYGSANATPHLDRLGADSVVFDQAYSAAPWTLPSLASILTGLPPAIHGARRLGDSPAAPLGSLPEWAADAGYRTVAFGRNFFFSPRGHGRALTSRFTQSWFQPAAIPPLRSAELWGRSETGALGLDASTADLTNAAGDWAEAAGSEPFFLWLHVYDPHAPYDPPPDVRPSAASAASAVGETYDYDDHRRFLDGELTLSADVRAAIRALYDAETRWVDECVGDFLERLRAEGLYDGALIVLTSDHGEEIGEHGGLDHGHSLFEEQLAVPLLVKLPGSAVRTRVDKPISNASVAATMLETLGIEADGEELRDPTLAPYWNDSALPSAPDRPVFFEGSYRSDRKQGVRSGRWKLVRSLDLERDALFDLEADPAETADISRENADQVTALGALLDARNRSAAVARRTLGIQDADGSLDAGQRNRLRSLGYIQ